MRAGWEKMALIPFVKMEVGAGTGVAILTADAANAVLRRCRIKTIRLKHPNRSPLYWERRHASLVAK